MRIVADLHIHSRYARATSPNSSIKTLAEYAKIKGVDVLATGDFTHPLYLREIKEMLKEKGEGVYECNGTYFILGTEVSVIDEKHKMHHLLFAPSLECVEQICDALARYGDLKSDGRPVLKMSSAQLAEEIFNISERCVIIPAHAWTPWFSIFGSRSGVDSIKEAFEEYAERIFAIETGLSSDPAMNWLISALDRISLVSNSDAHSPSKIAREANVFDLKALSYDALFKAIKTRKGFVKTYEFYPEEGKYHYDGHRRCGISMEPAKAEEMGNRCPVCKKPLTLGVLHRVIELADRKKPKAEGKVPFQHIIPLPTIISKMLKKGENTLTVMREYMRIVEAMGNELKVFESSEEEIRKKIGGKIAEAIIKVKREQVVWKAGYDGVFGDFEFGEKNNLLNY